eukprot:CAMPEP_0117517300 /NCGR_PEP_ID=MMETSP0784-20121206/31542_1 /TAXON_ID=39447 /ORGANISM="" /LENGTH=380 /DNA_ID=CAMNT_0005313179 /DNA_START=48 /DNA_END=1187 /DNA_ORIENTATION=-
MLARAGSAVASAARRPANALRCCCPPAAFVARPTTSRWNPPGNRPPNVVRAASSEAVGFHPSAGPDAPQTEDGFRVGLPRWPAGWHDHLQYHFFFDGLFVQARVFLTPSLEEHSVWVYDHSVGHVEELLNSSERLHQADGECLDLTGARLHIHDGPGGGVLQLKGGAEDLEVSFKNVHTFSWLPAGQGSDAVIHRPDLELTLRYKGRTMTGRGYSKRYYGKYGPHWGYRFIQSSWLDGNKFLWTADATFRLGDGEAKYNYFKLLDGQTGELVQADSQDTYQQDCAGYAEIGGEKYVATVTPLAEWMHDYKAGDTNSRMQLRYCKIKLVQGKGGQPIEGYALNDGASECFEREHAGPFMCARKDFAISDAIAVLKRLRLLR